MQVLSCDPNRDQTLAVFFNSAVKVVVATRTLPCVVCPYRRNCYQMKKSCPAFFNVLLFFLLQSSKTVFQTVFAHINKDWTLPPPRGTVVLVVTAKRTESCGTLKPTQIYFAPGFHEPSLLSPTKSALDPTRSHHSKINV